MRHRKDRARRRQGMGMERRLHGADVLSSGRSQVVGRCALYRRGHRLLVQRPDPESRDLPEDTERLVVGREAGQGRSSRCHDGADHSASPGTRTVESFRDQLHPAIPAQALPWPVHGQAQSRRGQAARAARLRQRRGGGQLLLREFRLEGCSVTNSQGPCEGGVDAKGRGSDTRVSHPDQRRQQGPSGGRQPLFPHGRYGRKPVALFQRTQRGLCPGEGSPQPQVGEWRGGLQDAEPVP